MKAPECNEIQTLPYANTATNEILARRRHILVAAIVVWSLAGALFWLDIPSILFSSSICTRETFARATISPNGGMARGIELYRLNVGQLPTTLDDLIQKPANNLIADRWHGPYLPDATALLDPWVRPIRYQQTPKKPTPGYALWSVGINGIDESSPGAQITGDDIVSWKQ